MKRRKRKCPNCGTWFTPLPQTAYHQRFCSNPSCQCVRRRITQARWRRRNRDYFRGKENVERVRAWRNTYPGHSSRRYLRLIRLRIHVNRRVLLPFSLRKPDALQDLLFTQIADSKKIAVLLNAWLQDLCVFSSVFMLFCLRCR